MKKEKYAADHNVGVHLGRKGRRNQEHAADYNVGEHSGVNQRRPEAQQDRCCHQPACCWTWTALKHCYATGHNTGGVHTANEVHQEAQQDKSCHEPAYCRAQHHQERLHAAGSTAGEHSAYTLFQVEGPSALGGAELASTLLARCCRRARCKFCTHDGLPERSHAP